MHLILRLLKKSKREKDANDLLSEQSCIFPKILLALSGIPAPNQPVQHTPPADFGKGGTWAEGTWGREKPTSHTVLLCIQVCRHTSQFLHPQYSQWQNLKEDRKKASVKTEPHGLIASYHKVQLPQSKKWKPIVRKILSEESCVGRKFGFS